MSEFALEQRSAAWSATTRVIAAHVVMLRDAAILDDPVAAVLLTALDGVGRGTPAETSDLVSLVAAVDQRLDALTPAAAIGAGAVGRGQAEVVAALARLLIRADLLRLAEGANAGRRALLDLAGEHVFTLMPAHASGQPVQPTTLAHFLGGVIAPLGRAFSRLRASYLTVNQSPLGAGALASSGLPIDRERIADLLGFEGLVVNTFDAVAAVDLLAEAAGIGAAMGDPLARFLVELLAWSRAEPAALRFDDEWLAPVDPGLPQFRPASGLERLVLQGRQIAGDAVTIQDLLRQAAYGPATTTLAATVPAARTVLAGATDLAVTTAALLSGGVEVNRAYLANRAGRDYTTTSELADFLLAEEGIDPASARNIALMTVRQAMAAGIAASGITPAMIDANALLVLGRELGVEIERMQRALAPRRFLEKRGGPGGPAPAATRDYLDLERARLLADDRWTTETSNHLSRVEANLDQVVAVLLADTA
ncbi:MAG: lyase family protein [Chloroflexota bacterium]|nr:lyase family protein [Chloroflexota bacterium]